MIDMQYLVSVTRNRTEPTPVEAAAAIEAFDEQLRAGGHRVFSGGLAEPATATVIDNRAGAPVLSDGPYLETEEYLVGLWVLEAADLDVALRLAAAGSRACRARIEVRPFADA